VGAPTRRSEERFSVQRERERVGKRIGGTRRNHGVDKQTLSNRSGAKCIIQMFERDWAKVFFLNHAFRHLGRGSQNDFERKMRKSDIKTGTKRGPGQEPKYFSSTNTNVTRRCEEEKKDVNSERRSQESRFTQTGEGSSFRNADVGENARERRRRRLLTRRIRRPRHNTLSQTRTAGRNARKDDRTV